MHDDHKPMSVADSLRLTMQRMQQHDAEVLKRRAERKPEPKPMTLAEADRIAVDGLRRLIR